MNALEPAVNTGVGLGLFYETDNAAVYLYMDGTLRHVPNPATFLNLFPGQIDPAAYYSFPNAAAAPFPIGVPLMNGAQLVSIATDPSKGILLTDQMPWDPTTTVLRHVINPQQMTDFDFDWQKVVDFQGTPNFGVPLAVDTNKNVTAAQALAGYYAVYTFLILQGAMNPFFNYLLPNYPGRPATKYKALIKSQIVAAQAVVNALPNS